MLLNLVTLSFIFIITSITPGLASTWSEWWTYEGISGPDFWGLVNPEWSLCSKGKRQSPINIEPRHLLYDPQLKHLRIDRHKVSGRLVNTGRDVRLQLDEPNLPGGGGSGGGAGGGTGGVGGGSGAGIPHHVNISGGPLSYQYRVTDVILHFGSIDSLGSEHTVNGVFFPAEIQILSYNSDLYGNLSQAIGASNGLAVVSVIAQVGESSNIEFDRFAEKLPSIRYKGESVRMTHVSIESLLPQTTDYITYEGSLTQPGCQETVTWIIINKPIYLSTQHLVSLRDVMQGDASNPKVPMENNCRPAMPLNHRPVRTNINFRNPDWRTGAVRLYRTGVLRTFPHNILQNFYCNPSNACIQDIGLAVGQKSKECTMEKQLHYQAVIERR